MAKDALLGDIKFYSENWPVTPSGKRWYTGRAEQHTPQPHGLGILEYSKKSYYVGEMREGKRHGRGFMLRQEKQVIKEQYFHHYSYEQVMATAEFDSCGRVISTGPSGEVRTSEKHLVYFVKEQDGLWEDDVFLRPFDFSILRNEPFSQCVLSTHQFLLTSNDYPVYWGPYVTPVSEITDKGIITFNGYKGFVTPYDEDHLLVLTNEKDLFIVGVGDASMWETFDQYGNHSQHFCTLYPQGNEHVFETEGTVLKRCHVKRPFVEIGQEITEIADGCFSQSDSREALQCVLIPRFCQKIGKGAFRGCTHLKHVIAKGYVNIGDEAFAGCSQLSFVELNRGGKLGRDSFSGCDSLREFYDPRK